MDYCIAKVMNKMEDFQMKKMLLTVFAAGLTAVFAAGCVHFEYDGESAPVNDAPVKIVRKCPGMDKCGAKRLGKAVAWGNYQDVSRDRLEEYLKKEAAERGANVVLVTADQVVPDGTAVKVDPMVKTMETVSPNNTYSMNQLQQDFDGGYGQAELFGKNAKSGNVNSGTVRDYTRIIRADFMVCSDPGKACKAEKTADPAKK